MAGAVYRGLKAVDDLEFAYIDQVPKETEIRCYGKMDELVAYADVIWLTVKPQDLAGILEQLKSCDMEGKTVVSPVAGKTIAYIERHLGKKQHVVRIMPNLAMAYGKSVTAFASNQPDSPAAHEIFGLLEGLGKVVELDESGFDLFTSIFGSGPAFILAFMQVFKDKMQEFNLADPVLDELLLELIEGTTCYFAANRQQHSIEELIRNVTSKGGTTQAGLEYFREHEIGKHFEGVLDAARRRSEEMSD